MAEKKKAPESPEPEGEEKKKGINNKMLLFIIAGVVAVALLLGVIFWLVLSGGDKKEGDKHEGDENQVAVQAIYVSLGEKFVVTLMDEGQQHYLQTSLSVMTREQSVVEELGVHAPLIRSRLISLLGEQDFKALRTEEGKLALRAKVLQAVQDVLNKETGKPGIEQVFFTEFVLQ